MRSFDDIFAIAAERKGGADALAEMLQKPKTADALKKISDDRWLAMATKCIFQAGFTWKVVEAMWPGFEEVFNGFDIGRCSVLHEEDFDRLVSDTRIVRHGPKIRAVQENAVFFRELAAEHGSAATCFADWPDEDYIGLLVMLKQRGTRLGGNTGQYFLRFMGKNSFVLSKHVCDRLIAEGVIDKPPGSKSSMAAVQNAFNQWAEDSGRSFTEISKTLGYSIG